MKIFLPQDVFSYKQKPFSRLMTRHRKKTLKEERTLTWVNKMAFAGRTNCSRRGGSVTELFRQQSCFKGTMAKCSKCLKTEKSPKWTFLVRILKNLITKGTRLLFRHTGYLFTWRSFINHVTTYSNISFKLLRQNFNCVQTGIKQSWQWTSSTKHLRV